MYCGDFVCQLTPEQAETHTRRTYNIPPDVGLGWLPYNYLVTEGGLSVWACHTAEQFALECRKRKVVCGQWSFWENGVRTARLIQT